MSKFQDFLKSTRKRNAQTYTVSSVLIQCEGSEVGRAVTTIRDNLTGKIVDTSVTSLKEATENGVPMLNIINIADNN